MLCHVLADVSQHWATYLLTLSVLRWYMVMMARNERRPGLVELPDPTFAYLPLRDTSVPLSCLLWTSAGVFVTHWSEWENERFCWTFILFMVFRSLVLWLHPFQGHHTQIPLRDVFIERFMGATQPMLHDASFSGHTSMLVIMGLLMSSYRWWFWCATTLTILLLVISRVHYLADCIIAPPIVYSLYQLAAPLADAWCHHGLLLLASAGVSWWASWLTTTDTLSPPHTPRTPRSQ